MKYITAKILSYLFTAVPFMVGIVLLSAACGCIEQGNGYTAIISGCIGVMLMLFSGYSCKRLY